MTDGSSLEAAALPTDDSAPLQGRRVVVDGERLKVDPDLVNTPLASGWQRGGAMVVDLGAIGALSLLANPVLGLLTGATLAALGSRRESVSKIWGIVRWGLIVLGVVVMVISLFALAGRPLTQSGAFNLAPPRAAPDLVPVVISPTASSSELRRTATQLDGQVEWLLAENARLRDEIRGNSWLRLAADSSRTMGLTFGWAGIYFTLITTVLRGRTLGKLILRARVRRLDGRLLIAMDAFVRNGGYAAGLATGLLGFARPLWDPNRQAIQYRIAGTVVVSVKKSRGGITGSIAD